jgi:hypothetical protein
MPRKAIIKTVDIDNGLISVDYFSEQDQIISINTSIPLNEDGNFIKPDDLVETIKRGYPEYDFKFLNAQKDPVNLYELKALENLEEENHINLNSRYGTEYEIDTIRYIVLNTLTEMGIIR